MRRPRVRGQRGVALIALLAVIALGASWYLVSNLNAQSANAIAAVRTRNAETLNRAKQALIGYVAAQAAKTGEDNPGALPCPEHAWYIDQPTKDGGAGPSVGVANPGYGTANCSSIGRYPWRTIGTDKMVDASGEPLWIVVGPSWRKTSTSTKTVINSNSTGDLTVDGVQAVAVIVAPGAAINAQAGVTSAGLACGARAQARAAPSGTMDPLDYLECFNSGTLQFSSAGPSASFNDQVVAVTTADLLPAVEAAVAHRVEREIAPLLKSMYSGGSWSGSSSSPALPWAAAFANPATSGMTGASGSTQGILPLAYAETSPGSGTLCTAGAGAPRCNPTFVSWSSANMSGVYSPSCTTTATQVNCTYYYQCWLWLCGVAGGTSVPLTINATASNVGMAMRQLNTSAAITNIDSGSATASAVLNANGSATVAISATATPPATGSLVSNALCGISGFLSFFLGCAQYSVTVPITLFADHPLLDSTSTGANPGWFLRNNWHQVAYYAIAPGFAPNGAKSCTTGGTCLTVNYHRNSAGAVDAGKQRALLLLSGRTLTGAARPNGTLSDWLEGANADGASPFEIRSATSSINRTFNDRVAVLDSN